MTSPLHSVPTVSVVRRERSLAELRAEAVELLALDGDRELCDGHKHMVRSSLRILDALDAAERRAS